MRPAHWEVSCMCCAFQPVCGVRYTPCCIRRDLTRTELISEVPYLIRCLLSLLSFYYFTISQLHSYSVSQRHSSVWEASAGFTRGPICRSWVIDGVHTLNIAGIRLHFLHLLCLRKSERGHEENRAVIHTRQEIIDGREVTNRRKFWCREVGLLATAVKRRAKKLNELTRYLIHFGLLVFLLNDQSYLKILFLLCVKSKNPAKNATTMTTVGTTTRIKGNSKEKNSQSSSLILMKLLTPLQ